MTEFIDAIIATAFALTVAFGTAFSIALTL